MMRTVAWILACASSACGAAMPSPSDDAQATAYTARELACVEEAGAPGLRCVDDAGAAVKSPECVRAREESDQCRCAVRAEYHRECDGGVP
jgi:hypothetical protein